MRRRARTLGTALPCLSIVLVATACQADGDGAGGTPIEEPSSVTETADEPSSTDDTAPGESTSDESTSGDEDAAPPVEDPDETRPTLVQVTRPPAKTTLPVATRPLEPATETVYEVGLIDAGLEPFVQLATADLATRLDAAPDSIEVLTAVLVTWPDASLGCPEPDRVYATVLTDGSVIELGIDGLVYRYHSGADRPPFPCDLPLDPVPEPMVGRSS